MRTTSCLGLLALACGGCLAASDPVDDGASAEAIRGPVGIRALTLSAYDQRFWPDYPEFSGGVVHSDPDRVIAMLRAARQHDFRIWLTIETKEAAPNRVFDRERAIALIEAYRGIDLAPYRDVLVGIMLIDEPQLESRWGPGGVAMTVVDDVLARRARAVFPGYPISVRLSPTTLEQLLPHPHYVDTAWGTYKDGRSGDVGPWMRAEHAAANRMGIEIEWTINAYRAPGDGPFISPELVRSVGTALAADPHSDGVNLWTKLATGEDPVAELQTHAMHVALADVARAMVARQ